MEASMMRTIADRANITTIPQTLIDSIKSASECGKYSITVTITASEQDTILRGLDTLGYGIRCHDDDYTKITIYWGV